MPTYKERVQELRTLMASFTVRPLDPTGPDQSLYCPFHKEPGKPRGRDPIEDLKSTIDLSPEKGTSQLFSGFQGTGKTTELRRLEGSLQKDGLDVLFVEGEKYINLYQPLEVSDLLLSVATAVAELFRDRLNKSLLKRSPVEHVNNFFSRIKLTSIDAGLGVSAPIGQGGAAAPRINVDIAKLRLELRENPDFKARVQDYQRGKLSELIEAFKELMQGAREALGSEKCPVLLVDDLEKVQGSGPQREAAQQQIEHIFSASHHALKIEGWHSIWACPPYLRFLNSAIPSHYDGYVTLPMVRLWSDDDPKRARSPEGFEAMRRFLRLRGTVDSLVEDEGLLDELIFASSGHVRDLCRLMQSVLRRVVGQEDPNKPLADKDVQEIIGDYVGNYQLAVYTEDHDFLRKVAEQRRVDFKSRSEAMRIAKLFDTQLVMVYRNGREWFDVSVPVQRLLARLSPPVSV